MEGKAPTDMPRSSSLVCPFAAKGALDGKHPNQQTKEGSPRPMNQACTARQIVCACGKRVCVDGYAWDTKQSSIGGAKPHRRLAAEPWLRACWCVLV